MSLLRVCLGMIWLAVLASAPTSAQQRSELVISGSIYDVKPVVPSPLRPHLEQPAIPSAVTQFDVRIRLHIYNRSEAALIIPSLHTFPGDRSMLFLTIPSAAGNIVTVAEEVKDPKRAGRMADLVKSLKQDHPFGGYFRMIRAGDFFEMFETIRVTSGYKLERHPSKEVGGPDVELVAPELPFFRIRYHLRLADGQALADAKRRWANWGDLLSGPGGNITIETEPIVNKLRDAPEPRSRDLGWSKIPPYQKVDTVLGRKPENISQPVPHRLMLHSCLTSQSWITVGRAG